MHILSHHCTNVAERNLFSVLYSCLHRAPIARSSFEKRCKQSDVSYTLEKLDCLLLPASSNPEIFWRQILVTANFGSEQKVADHLRTNTNKSVHILSNMKQITLFILHNVLFFLIRDDENYIKAHLKYMEHFLIKTFSFTVVSIERSYA